MLINKLNNNAPKLFKYFKIVSRMSSLLEIYNQELQIFQKLFCLGLKPTIDDNQIFKIRKNNGHMKVEASLENDKE
jgi:hypothetical protein